ncbi:hypothetical protein BH18THE2_BH18THE2_38320 [soil metagenome]
MEKLSSSSNSPIMNNNPWKALSENNRLQILLLIGKRDITPTEIAQHLNSSLAAATLLNFVY